MSETLLEIKNLHAKAEEKEIIKIHPEPGVQARALVLRVLSVFSSEYIYRREKESGVSSETENKMVEIDRGDPFDCGGLSDWYVAEHEEDDGEYQRCGKERGEKDRHYL